MMGLWSRPIRPRAFQHLLTSVRESTSLSSALYRYSTFWNLLLDDYQFELVDHGDARALCLHPQTNGVVQRFGHMLILKLAHGVLSWLARSEVDVKAVDFAFEHPAFKEDYALIFPAPIKFSASVTAIHFEAGSLVPVQFRSTDDLHRFLENAPRDWLFTRSQEHTQSLRLRVYRRQSTWEEANLDEAAKALHMTPRTLIRRLEADGTSFQAIKDGLRRDIGIGVCKWETPVSRRLRRMLVFPNPPVSTRRFTDDGGNPQFVPAASLGARLSLSLLDKKLSSHEIACRGCRLLSLQKFTKCRVTLLSFANLIWRDRRCVPSHKDALMSDKLETIRAAARDHARDVIAPNVDAWNAERASPRAASDQAGAVGLTGLYAPEEWGGQGLPLSEGIQVDEQLGTGDGAYAFALSMHNICTFAGCGYGTDAFKEKWVNDLTSGRKLANFALTEPQPGSDPMKMYTRATINGDGTWTISGAKAWVSLATEADIYFTVVKTSDTPGHKDMAMIAIPADAPGLRFGPLYDTPSCTFLPMSEMYLDEVFVSEDNIILPIGQGLQGSLMAIDIARVSIASGCCGLMQAALDTALAYSKTRKMFGGKNLELDGIQWMLGEVATDLEASKLLYRKAAEALGTPEGPLLAAHAKRFVPDAAVKAANTCTQLIGGIGLLQPYGLDRLSRLAQMLRIVDGTTEVSRVVIGRALQRRAAGLPDIPVPKGYGEITEDDAMIAAE